jgi:WD40 repeat protein
VTLGTPPSEVVDGVPTTHLVITAPGGADGAISTIEFWVDPQPPTRVRRLALTTVAPYPTESWPALPSRTEPGAFFVVNEDWLHLRRLPDGALLRTIELAHPAGSSIIQIAGFTPDGQSMIGLWGGKCYRWNLQDGHIEAESRRVNAAGGYALSPDGRFLAIGDEQVAVYRTTDWQRTAEMLDTLFGTNILAFSPDDRLVAGVAWPPAETRDGPTPRVLQIWNSDGTLLRTQPFERQDTDQIDALVFTPDSQRLVTHARGNGAVEIRQVADGKLLHTFAPATPGSAGLAISPDGRWLALASEEGQAFVWDLQNPAAAPVQLKQAPGQVEPMGSPQFSADGQWLLVNPGGVLVWHVPAFDQAPVYWPLRETLTNRFVWHWGHFNEPVNIPSLRLAPTATP